METLGKTASHYCSNKILEQTVDLRLQVSFAIAKLPSVPTTAIKGLQRQKGRANCTSQLCTKQYLNQTNRWHVGRSVRRCHIKTDHHTHTRMQTVTHTGSFGISPFFFFYCMLLWLKWWERRSMSVYKGEEVGQLQDGFKVIHGLRVMIWDQSWTTVISSQTSLYLLHLKHQASTTRDTGHCHWSNLEVQQELKIMEWWLFYQLDERKWGLSTFWLFLAI